jgi:hypothetical protein
MNGMTRFIATISSPPPMCTANNATNQAVPQCNAHQRADCQCTDFNK